MIINSLKTPIELTAGKEHQQVFFLRNQVPNVFYVIIITVIII